MKRNSSESSHQQFFIQSLRNSVHGQKEFRDREYHIKNGDQYCQQKSKNQPSRSVSNSSKFKLQRKKSIYQIKQRQKCQLKCYLINDQIQINLPQIFLQLNSSQTNLKNINQQNKHKNIYQLKQFRILIEFIQKNILEQKQSYNKNLNSTQSKGEKIQIQKKLEISWFQLSVEESLTNIKKTYPINLKEELLQKHVLRINGKKDNLIVKNIKFNSVELNVQKLDISKFIGKQKDVYSFDPWEVIDKQSILLKNRISLDRPKSQIKWSLSTQVSSNNSHKAQYTQKSDKNKNQIQQNYGIKSYQSKLISSMFLSQQKKQSTNSMSSTIQEQTKTTDKKNVFCSNLKRKNNMISSFDLNQYKKDRQNQQRSANSSRSRSSFRNLKQKNDYFQMKESQRKRSIKKNLQQSVQNYQVKQNQLSNSHRFSQVKLQYGIK